MRVNDSATVLNRPVVSAGVAWGFLGVAAFSFTVPLTRVAIDGGLDPLFVGSARAVVAAALAAIALAATRQRLPRIRQWARLAIVALGVIVGFPILTSFALVTADASHSAVVIALLPAATAVAAVVRAGERPGPAFWTAALLGAAVAVGFAIVQGGLDGLAWADLLLFGAVVAAAIGYAEGGLLARELGAWQTISWALVLSAPGMLVLALVSPPFGGPIGAVPWLAFGYLAVVSMLLGFFAWYRGLGIGPIATVSQIQLAQPALTVAWAVILLGEPLTLPTVIGAIAVVACAAIAVRAR
ncbi:DMT family transporter [Microbacterium karelineae]|uniref:DMT family transporter n=1 Tax=Microbacterium karelineae TaxID=2654283 RepID=UPI0012EA246D|nr:DMT family transporter [Microbacterium karelineae]